MQERSFENHFGPAVKLQPNPLFFKMCQAAHKGGGTNPRLSPPHIVLAMDPGETTGLACWDPWTQEILLWQEVTKEIGPSYDKLSKAICDVAPEHLRAEDYKVYGWKANEHAFASLHTPRWLGAIEVACYMSDIPFSVKLAQMAKTWWTDDKLKACGIYHPGLKHARDACRHLALYLAFGAADSV